MKQVLALLGKCFITLAGMALLVAAGLFVVGGFCVTYPILRLPPRQRHMRVVLDLVTAAQAAAVVFKDSIVGEAGIDPPASPSPSESVATDSHE